jgi:hypothetical protein
MLARSLRRSRYHPLSPDTHGSSFFRCSENPCRPPFLPASLFPPYSLQPTQPRPVAVMLPIVFCQSARLFRFADTPCWSSKNHAGPISTVAQGTSPVARNSCASHSSDAQRFFPDPFSIGQFPSFNTHSSPDNPNPLSRASSRNQALNSPVIASLILHVGVIFFMPAQSLRWAR